MLPPTALREVLNASITSGQFVDTKIYLFSHRNSAGDVCKPKALYANSVVFKSVPYFNDLFSGNYSETATKDLDEDIADEGAIAKHYDYNSDSDLEDAEDLKAMEKPPPPLRGHPFDPFCFSSPDENDSSESNTDITADEKPQDAIRYFWASSIS
ncbi:hypothetical protein BDM02DRAFT_3187778 [Thelephora ganbajun]|uniref:Uncharacterized protein n=1 Tax=Thelephora ganbajun TaxID=370292 RepID=A0ACB6ZEW8_THEGA|nr:hypothetical protein BDM02DRAFT_3187778 [Thelephora ganbajun]